MPVKADTPVKVIFGLVLTAHTFVFVVITEVGATEARPADEFRHFVLVERNDTGVAVCLVVVIVKFAFLAGG